MQQTVGEYGCRRYESGLAREVREPTASSFDHTDGPSDVPRTSDEEYGDIVPAGRDLEGRMIDVGLRSGGDSRQVKRDERVQ
jgi:hypothetical protein